MRLRSLVYAFFLFQVSLGYSEVPDLPFVFVDSEISGELSQQSVQDIFQDSIGFLWISTQDGLNRYDGRSVSVYRTDTTIPGTLSGSYTRDIVEDDYGNIWIATDGGGLNRYLPASDTFENITSSSQHVSLHSNNIWSLARDQENGLWLGYTDGGFSNFNPNSKPRLIKHFTANQSPILSDYTVTNILQVDAEQVLIATDGGGVLVLSIKSEQISVYASISDGIYEIGSNRVSDLLLDPSGVLWITTYDAGAWSVDTATGSVNQVKSIKNVEIFEEPIEAQSLPMSQVFRDVDGRLFFATRRGIGLYDDEEAALDIFQSDDAKNINDDVKAIFQDQSGRYWVGAYAGLSEGFISKFYRVDSRNGLNNEMVTSFEEANDGSRWIGTASGLFKIPASGSFDKLSPFKPDVFGELFITSLMAEEGYLWIGTVSDGVKRFDLSRNSIQSFIHDPSDATSISENAITQMTKDRDGNLWVGTRSRGLNMMSAKSFGEFKRFMHNPRVEDSISDDTIYSIYQEGTGDLWVGTSYGLNRYDYVEAKFKRFYRSDVDASERAVDRIYAIYEDHQSRLWIGREGGGLDMWEPFDRKKSIGKFRHFQQNIELPASNVYAIQGDGLNNLWFASSGGISRLNADNPEGDYQHFSVKDGLLSNFNLGASFKDKHGWLYFGTTAGFNTLYPPDILKSKPEPALALTRVVTNNETRRFDFPYAALTNTDAHKIELAYNDYMLGFEFALLDFNAPRKINYRYQMVGLNSEWVELGNKNSVDFTNLGIGEKTFKVSASQTAEDWGNPLSVEVVVHPPPWMAWWAFFLYIAGVLAVVMIALERQRQRERLQMQYQSQLESDVRARTRDLKRANENLYNAVEEAGMARQEAIEANQAKSEFLAALSHEIRTPMHGVLGMTDLLMHSGLSERQSGFANSAHQSANELLSLIDNILDFSKIEAGRLELEETTFDLREVTESLCYLYGEMAQAKGVELNLIFRANLRRQVYGDPVRLRQILQNLLSNAIKFTKRGSVTVRVDIESQAEKATRVRFSVEDTGIGMDKETQERVFEAFSQADSSTTRQFGGTGLGLSIAKQLIELMGGTLKVDSVPGAGTNMQVTVLLTESPIYVDKLSVAHLEDFYAQVVAPSAAARAMLNGQMEMLSLQAQEFTSVEEVPVQAEKKRLVLVDVSCLYGNPHVAQVQNLAEDALTTVLLVAPLSLQGIPKELEHLPHTEKPCRTVELMNDISEALAPQQEVAATAAPGAAVMRYEQRVLVVEDMTANQEIARAMLESFGCQVDVAKNGSVALEMYQQENYDIILMDCQMPVMDGFEATRHIRRLESQQAGNVRIPVVAVTAGKTEVEKERCFASGMDRILFKPYTTEELNQVLAHYFTASGKVPARPAQSVSMAGSVLAEREREPSVDLIDMKALDNIRSVELQTGNNLLAKVFENFKQDAESKIAELRAGLDDPALLGSGAHAIKSMSLNIGAKALSEYCRQRENDWKAGNIEQAAREVEVLYGHYLDAAKALQPIVSAPVAED